MCNVELNAAQAVVESTSYAINVHDVFAIILCFAVFGIAMLDGAIETFLRAFKDVTSWENNLMVKRIMLILRGFIGIVIVVYVIYLLATWRTWNWRCLFYVLIFSPIIGLFASYILWAVAAFGYKCLYEPLACLISYFKKK